MARRIRRVAILIVVISFFLVGGLGFFQFFKIQNIIVEGAENVSGTDYVDGSLIFLTNKDQVEQYLFDKNPTFSHIDVEKVYPNTLRVSVEASHSVAYIEAEGGYLMLGESGRVIQKPKVGMVPRRGARIETYQKLYYDQNPIGTVIQQPEIQYILPLLSGFARLGFPCERVVIENFHMVVCNSDTRKIVLSTEKSGQEVFGELKEVVSKLHVSGQEFSELDLRFDKPILKLTKNE